MDEQKGHRRTIRIRGADYTDPGGYLVTIYADKRRGIFGRIKDGPVILTALGEIVRKCWVGIPQHFSIATLKEFVVMPNHLHGIIVLERAPVGARYIVPSDEKARTPEGLKKPVTGSIPTMVRTFKAAVTREAQAKLSWKIAIWQRNYYEHVSRNGEYLRASGYILENLKRWAWDKENPEAQIESSEKKQASAKQTGHGIPCPCETEKMPRPTGAGKHAVPLRAAEKRARRAVPLRVLAVVLCAAIGAAAPAQTPKAADAMALEQQGKWTEAAQVWKAVAEANPHDAGAFASLGVDLSRQQKYADAAAAYRKALALNPRLPGIHLNLGLAEFKQGHFPPAIAPLQAALRADPKSQQARALLGMSYYGAGRFAEASKQLEVAAKADPGNSELLQILAQSCLWSKNYSCALDQFKAILQLNPDSPSAHVLLGEALDGLGRTPEALVEFQAAAKASPAEPNINFGLGFLYWKLRQDGDAKAAFERELALDPSHAHALAYLGDVELRNGNAEKSLELLRRAIRVNREILLAHVDLGSIYVQQKHYPEALAEFRTAVKLDPGQPEAHFRLGRLYQAMGNSSAAKEEFAKVNSIHQKASDEALEKMSGSPPPLKP